MFNKKAKRLRRATKIRAHIRELGAMRLTIHRTPQHIYAQVMCPKNTVIAVASTVQKNIATGLKSTGNVEAAKAVGAAIAQAAIAKGVTAVAFDRSGFAYHGRVAALADAAREAGLQF